MMVRGRAACEQICALVIDKLKSRWRYDEISSEVKLPRLTVDKMCAKMFKKCKLYW